MKDWFARMGPVIAVVTGLVGLLGMAATVIWRVSDHESRIAVLEEVERSSVQILIDLIKQVLKKEVTD